MPDQRKKLGRYGEEIAAQYLMEHEYKIIHRNWRCKTGELDIIAMFDTTLIFVEVRTRRLTGTFGSPQEAINTQKQWQVRNTAQYYMHQFHKHHSLARFDFIAVELNKEGALLQIHHIEHAF